MIFHSIVRQYMTPGERARVHEVIEAAGAAASSDGPVAWLRMEPPEEGEPDDGLAVVTLTCWPGGGTEVIARSGYHGRPVRWLG